MLFSFQKIPKEIINNDKFRLAKNPLLLGAERFSNVGKYMASLMEGFKKQYNATTLELPMTEEYFDLPIKNTLFKAWHSQAGSRKLPKNRNQTETTLVYERKVIENRVEKHFYGLDKPDFKFHIKFGKFKQVFRTKENLAKFILNLLNGLSLWLSISFFQTFVLKSGLFEDCPCKTTNPPSTRQSSGRIGSLFTVTAAYLKSRHNSV